MSSPCCIAFTFSLNLSNLSILSNALATLSIPPPIPDILSNNFTVSGVTPSVFAISLSFAVSASFDVPASAAISDALDPSNPNVSPFSRLLPALPKLSPNPASGSALKPWAPSNNPIAPAATNPTPGTNLSPRNPILPKFNNELPLTGGFFKLVNLPVFGSLPTVGPPVVFFNALAAAAVPATAAPAAILPAIAPAIAGPPNKSPIAATVPAMTTGSENIALKPSFIPSANATPIGASIVVIRPLFSLPSPNSASSIAGPKPFSSTLPKNFSIAGLTLSSKYVLNPFKAS